VLKEACGVFGVWAPGERVSHLTFDGIFALQHRGQESAGMAVSDENSITVLKDTGLVTSVFNERALQGLTGTHAIGHTRYSTAGSMGWESAQPFYRSVGEAGFALAHNGNLTNTEALVDRAGMLPGMALTDSDVLAELIASTWQASQSDGLAMALHETLPFVEGAFSLTLIDRGHIYAVRDPHGFRPLCLGALGDPENPTGWVVASESPALDIIGATFVREIEPGEIVTINADGVRSQHYVPVGQAEEKLCIFEYVYFARPDSYLHGREVHGARRRMGQLLAAQAPVEADLVMGVPDSGVPAAEGFALASGIPFGHGLVKNRYIGRTFIAPDQQARERAVKRKFNPLRENILGKRIIVVDDSIVRGTTTRALVKMLREAGAAEVHLRISSPPFQWPCFYGIDTPDRGELLAATKTLEEIAEFIGCDSLDFISLKNLRDAIGEAGGFCDACLTGNYPTKVLLDSPTSKQAVAEAEAPQLQRVLPGV
jgi:amidophosphoribosyltransferase